ncbi:MAG: phasin family protein [Nitrospirae bacterium]|nr:phasin family protein [Nitrospirota bacterium]
MKTTAPKETQEEEARIIKRYPNRKLYDTSRSKYIKLDEIADLIREGQEIRIIDNDTDEDLTSVILTQVIYEEQKKKKSLLPIQPLRGLIQSFAHTKVGERFQESTARFRELLEEYLTPSGQLLFPGREELEKHIEKLIKRGQITSEDGRRFIQGVLKVSRRSVDEIQKRIDVSMKNALARLNIPTKRDVEALRRRVDELIRRLDHRRRKY